MLWRGDCEVAQSPFNTCCDTDHARPASAIQTQVQALIWKSGLVLRGRSLFCEGFFFLFFPPHFSPSPFMSKEQVLHLGTCVTCQNTVLSKIKE